MSSSIKGYYASGKIVDAQILIMNQHLEELSKNPVYLEKASNFWIYGNNQLDLTISSSYSFINYSEDSDDEI